MASENKYGNRIPADYLQFLYENPNGCYIDFSVDPKYEPEIKMFSNSELTENIEMNSIGNALQYEILTLYIKFQQDVGFADADTSILNEEQTKRVGNGFVIGYTENLGGYGYFYLDASDDHSVWIYNTNNGQINKIANSFKDFINHIKNISTG